MDKGKKLVVYRGLVQSNRRQDNTTAVHKAKISVSPVWAKTYSPVHRAYSVLTTRASCVNRVVP